MTKGTGMPESAKSVISWALAVGILAFILLVMALIFGNLFGNTGIDRESTTYTNESGWLNSTGHIISGFAQTGYVSFSITDMTNTTGGATIPTVNYTLNQVTGNITNATIPEYTSLRINFTYVVTHKGQAELGSEGIIGNYTESTVNTSQQFPTIGTILGIVVLLAILISLLVFVITKLTGVTTGGSGGGTFGGSSKSSGGFERGGMR